MSILERIRPIHEILKESDGCEHADCRLRRLLTIDQINRRTRRCAMDWGQVMDVAK